MNHKIYVPATAGIALIILMTLAVWDGYSYDFNRYQQHISKHLQFKKAFRQYILHQRRLLSSDVLVNQKLNSYALGARMTELFSAIYLKDPEATIEVAHLLENLCRKDEQTKIYVPTLQQLKRDVSTDQWNHVQSQVNSLYTSIIHSNIDQTKFNFGHWIAQVDIAHLEEKDLRYHISASKYFVRYLPPKDFPAEALDNLQTIQDLLKKHPTDRQKLQANLDKLRKLINI